MTPVDSSAADVVVVGAGFAGLTAAFELQRSGLDVVVLEARDRVGGKVESVVDALGLRVDTGGQFVCDDVIGVLDLIGEQGRQLVAVDHDRGGRAFLGGSVTTPEPIELWQAFERAEAAYASLWDHAEHVGSISLGSWFARAGLDPDALRAARSALNGVMCIDIEHLPLAHVIDLARRTPLTRDELQYIVAETLHSVAEELAEALERPVLLGTPARAVRLSDDCTDVTVISDRRSIHAQHAVIAVPPTAYGSISFSPPLPAPVTAAAEAFRAGSVIKFLVRYAEPFWDHDEASATAVWLQPEGLYVGDASLNAGSSMLVAFLGGPATVQWRAMPKQTRRRALLDRLVEAYGTQASDPISFVERDWDADSWGGGGYWNVLVDATAHHAVGTLQRGAPGITFASTELSNRFPGYVEGAIMAGRAAATTVAALVARR
ncbi:flavin monoamine oxidase family protein [soil metagenome]